MKPATACRFLENKEYYLGEPATEEEREEIRSRPPATPFWCLRTHDAIGPDGGEVGDHCCGPDRPCFRAEVEL